MTPTPTLNELRTINHHLRLVLDQVEEGVLVTDAQLDSRMGPEIVFVNHGLCDLLDVEAEELVGRPMAEVFGGVELQGIIARLPQVAQSGKCFLVEMPLGAERAIPVKWKLQAATDLNGHLSNFLFTVSVPKGINEIVGRTDGLGMQEATPVEVVDEKESEECDDEKMKEQSRLESLALVTRGIAHDFNNMLTSIIANISLAKLDPKGEDDLIDRLDDAMHAADKSKVLMERLLAYARGGTKAKKVNANFGKIVRDAVRLSTYGASVRCDANIADDIWECVVDPTQLMQVVQNLLINARQAMKDEGVIQANLENVELDVDTELELPPGKYLRLKVIDHGCGIPKDGLAKIFQPFYTTKEKGSGIGLSTCQTIVRHHDGIITVDSEEGVGTEFTVYIPATGELVREKQADKEAGEVKRGEGTVLVLDDQDEVRVVARAMLERMGYEVIEAPEGEDAIKLYKRRMSEGNPVSCLLMDMTLPGGMSGSETAHEIRKLDPFAVTIASSGYFDSHDDESILREGFNAMIA
ncbi:MAG: ATP-binding protein, partial [Verrucomicrobiota bacterium]